MKVIVDDKIPFIKEALDTLADEVIYAPGKDFTPELVRDADALIIRTRTRCDRLTRLIARRQALRGRMLLAVIQPPWPNTCTPPSCSSNARRASD